MATPTYKKVAYGCLGAIAVAFVGLFALLFALPEDSSDSDTSEREAEAEEASLAEATRDYFYDDRITVVDGEDQFDSPGEFDEEIDHQVPVTEWQDSENAHEIVVTAIPLNDEQYNDLCHILIEYALPPGLDGRDGRLDLRSVIVEDEDGEVRASCEADWK
ncbi:hypothetical protein DFP74_3270 [Nocardiopsis sp. Huas11]|uniref:hypothetical protein n=1 Tax=Nocardiopsis sp. Huas11 TaxID=2183912 RepID=UPI000EAFF613|nr:hypothetical protein [Nocardiopsis sp. Huas11]RKS07592.1 hypothetical protein DFP74_3270 [Nocardiopsis sp. Huas11]